MSTPSGAYKIWRHPHLKLVDKCLQYVVWFAMRLDKLDSVAKLAGPEGAKARRRMAQFNADAADRVDRRAVVLVTPGASADAAARAEALGTERGWSFVTAKPARCAEVVASLL